MERTEERLVVLQEIPSIPARHLPLTALGWVGARVRWELKTALPATLGLRENLRSLWIRKVFLKQNIFFAADPWLGGGAECLVPHLSEGLTDRTAATCSSALRLGRIRECKHLLFREKISPILFFNLSSKTKAFESSNSCPWRLLHQAQE